MKTVIRVSNAHTLGVPYEMGAELEIVREKKWHHDQDVIELENDIWLAGTNDGRYYTLGDGGRKIESEPWAAVYMSDIVNIDEDGDEDISNETLLGYTRIDEARILRKMGAIK